jgi:hypothetical protein
MKFALILIAFGVANGHSIISGAQIAVVPVESAALCEAARTAVAEAGKTGYAPMVAVCIQVRG